MSEANIICIIVAFVFAALSIFNLIDANARESHEQPKPSNDLQMSAEKCVKRVTLMAIIKCD